MRKLSRNVAALAAGITLSVAACGGDDDPTGLNSGDPLTSAEAQELASEVFDILFNIGLTGSPSVAAPIDAPAGPIVRFGLAAVAEPIPNTSVPCEGGGTVSVSGDVSASSSSTSFDITEQISNCVTTSSTGTTFTLNGDPNIRMTGSVTVNGQTSFTMDLNINGGIRFSTSDSRSGSCSVSISMGGTVDLNNLNNPNAISVSGSVCGQNINSI